jgi:electron transport complex protein RnfD
MRDVIIALIPAGAVGIWAFGLRALALIAIAVVSSILTEAIIQKIRKQKVTISDLSAAVTGLLLAYNLPVAVPLWIPVAGSVIAIGLVKQAFGGLGHNFMNPALAARAILLSAWPVNMTTWVAPKTIGFSIADAVSSPTPLALLKGEEVTNIIPPSYMDLFLGNIGGCIGEVSVVALLIGAIYLLYRRVINWRIPVGFIGTVVVFTFVLGGDQLFTGDFVYHILSGGLMLGAFYMATDYSSSPDSKKGQLVMGIGCGVITAIIRLYGGYPEGVSYSILLMNLAVPLIDKWTLPRKFGEVKQHA